MLSRVPGSDGVQSAAAVLMVRPAAFGWNPQTEPSNRFQRLGTTPAAVARDRALDEFDSLASALRDAGVETIVLADRPEPTRPDAVFPNNWLSLHADGTVVLYPMLAPNRRLERRTGLVGELEERGFAVTRLLDLTHHELAGRFLEGTGSVVFDHLTRRAYACHSPRTHPAVLRELCDELGYEPRTFVATDEVGTPVYHTNVVLSIGRRGVILCADAVAPAERGSLLEDLACEGRRIVAIDHAQMASFAGNALELRSRDGSTVLAMSERGLASLAPEARAALADCVDRILAVPVPTIEEFGGGSVRCMLAEVFLPRRGHGAQAQAVGQ